MAYVMSAYNTTKAQEKITGIILHQDPNTKTNMHKYIKLN